MSTRNERFNKGMKSLDALCEGMDISKWPAVSDKGAGVRRIVSGFEAERIPLLHWTDQQRRSGFPSASAKKERLLMAERCLVEARKEHLIPVLRLIVQYAGDRQQILEKVPRRTYFRQRNELLEFFCGTRWC